MSSPFYRTLRALEADGAARSWLGWGVGGVLILAWLTWFFAGRVTVFETSRTARLEAVASAHPVAAPHAGSLVRSALVLGSEVKAGDVLLELDDRSAALSLREESQRLAAVPAARAALRAELLALQRSSDQADAASEAAVRAARDRAAEVAAQLAFARDHERRLAEEARVGGVAEVDLLRARAESRRLDARRSGLEAEAQRLALDAHARASQQQSQREALEGRVTALVAEAEALATRVQRLQTERDQFKLRAPADGVLADIAALQPGAWIAEGQHVATVLPQSALRVVAEFSPATALGRVQAGQRAEVRLDGFSWMQYGSLSAHVERVAGEVRNQRIRVELVLDPAGPRSGFALQHGLSGQVEVALEALSPAQLLLRHTAQRLAGAAPEVSAEPPTRAPLDARGGAP